MNFLHLCSFFAVGDIRYSASLPRSEKGEIKLRRQKPLIGMKFPPLTDHLAAAAAIHPTLYPFPNEDSGRLNLTKLYDPSVLSLHPNSSALKVCVMLHLNISFCI